MTHAARINSFGGPEVLEWQEVEVGSPAAHEIRIRQTAVGVNYADIYMRSGNHFAPLKFPATLGVEAAGVVEEAGTEVREFARGDRVAYFGALGAYSEARLVPADRVVRIPAWLNDRLAASLMVKGITARYLCRQAYAVTADDVVLVHSAAGGVGSFLAQWCGAIGACVIGTVGSDTKVEVALAHGCRHVIVSTRESVPERVAALTGGAKATVVFDPVGGENTLLSLDCLRPRGTLVAFGRTAGYPHAIVPFEHLMLKGSLQITMTQLSDFAGNRTDIGTALQDLLGAIERGQIRPVIGQDYALRDVAQAHRDLEARRTTGAVVLRV